MPSFLRHIAATTPRFSLLFTAALTLNFKKSPTRGIHFVLRGWRWEAVGGCWPGRSQTKKFNNYCLMGLLGQFPRSEPLFQFIPLFMTSKMYPKSHLSLLNYLQSFIRKIQRSTRSRLPNDNWLYLQKWWRGWPWAGKVLQATAFNFKCKDVEHQVCEGCSGAPP
jgi:hypothetical protein